MKHKGLVTILLSLGMVTFAASQSIDEIVNQPYAKRQGYFLTQYYAHPVFNDSVAYFKKVENLKLKALKHKDEELLFETKLMRFNYLSSKNYKPYKSEMLELIKEIDKTGINQLQARARQALGLHFFYENMNYADALMYLTKSYDLIKDIPVSDLPDKQEMIYNIAFVNYKIGYYNTALKYLDIASKLTNPYWKNLKLNIINTKGLILKEKGYDKKASETFAELLIHSKEQNDAIFATLASCNLAEFYRKYNNYNAAFKVINDNSPSDEDHKLDENTLLRKKKLLANLYIDTNQQQSALSEINGLKEIVNKSTSVTPEIKNSIVPFIAYEKGKNGHFDESYKLMRQAMINENQSHSKNKIELVRQLDNKENIEKYFQYIAELDAEKKNKQIIILASSLIILLLIVLAIFFIQKQKLKYRQKQLRVKLQKKELSLKLKTANLELSKMKEFLVNQNAEMEHYKEELLALEQSNSPEEEKEKRKKHLNDLMNSTILTEQNWIDFKHAFEEVNSGYILELNNKMPGLTEAELRYLLLRKMDLTPKQIASMLGVSPDTIRQYKYRIRKKFNFENEDELQLELAKIS